ncbi:Tim44 domain-containing protein [Formicincola oecophyllae]|uniref:Tim44 domain-containing protein n=1 Tax=Formicincola oecophyllae TaxID=2558361 RepID=A0A4Y6UCT5_9PROT|nr:Tim44/TimA family putative adaptor protein [Formicincola oecophyllae]QDH13925.1 Tim44 domain-containing protein [Formicincola oecophyllae]
MDNMGHMASHVHWDLVVLAVLASVLVVCLYRVLGKRIGAQGLPQQRPLASLAPQGPDAPKGVLQPPPLPTTRPEAAPPTEHVLPDAGVSFAATLAEMAQYIPGFSPSAFLNQAEEIIAAVLAAYSAGDRKALQALLTPQVFAAFTAQLDSLAKEGLKPRIALKRIEKLTVVNALVENPSEATGAEVEGGKGAPAGQGSFCRIDVDVVSWQVSCIVNEQGQLTEGTEALTEFHECWGFFHSPGQSAIVPGVGLGPTWRVGETRAL